MNWDAIGAVAELAGAVGVIASLLYVATQVRVSNTTSLVHAKLETTRFMTDYADVMLQNPALNDVMIRGQRDFASLSPDEVWTFMHLATKAFWFFSAGHFQFRQGTLSESEWHELRSVLRFWLRAPGAREWWHTFGRPGFGPEFAHFVEAEIKIIKAQEPSGDA